VELGAEPLCNSPECGLDVGWLELHLGVAEAEPLDVRDGVRLVADEVLRLLGRGAVIAEAVGLHDEAEVGPVEVDFEAVDRCLGVRLRQAGSARDRDEEAFEFRGGEDEGRRVEEVAQRLESPSAGPLVDLAPQPIRVQVGVVTGMPRWRVTSLAMREVRRWTRMPRGRGARLAGTDTSICLPSLSRIPQSAAALAWLRTAPSPQARTAAIHLPWRVSSRRPTA
jgi:hypothetical protein